jgi:predicted unusual protein kinase regulating ubiquinone biosynthesis (AarF/ABC1/UbiB family)
MPIKSKGSGERTAKLLGVGLRTLGRSIIHKLPGGDRIERSAQHWADVGEDWVKTLGELRGAAMKMGQLASQYSDLLPKTLADQLVKLQNSVEPLPFDELKPALKHYWKAAHWKKIADIDSEALAAASIGQVHRATLVDGRRVIVKIRYPDIEHAVDSDIKQLRRLISASKLLPLDNAALNRLMEEVRQRFNEETNYRIEHANLLHLRKYGQVAGIVYPEPVESLCADGVLVMTEEAGEPIAAAKGWPQETRDRIGTTLCRWLAHEMFIARAVHADPHPGNFAFRPDGSIVVYDFGCVKHVPQPIVDGVRRVLRAAWRADWEEMHEAELALQGVGEKVLLDDVVAVYDDFANLTLHRLCTDPLFDYGDPGYADDLRDAARRHYRHAFTFKPVSDLVFVMRALSGTYWQLRSLRARVPMGELLAEHDVGPPGGD